MKYKKYVNGDISFIDWLKEKNILTVDILEDFNNNLKMYKVNKLDPSKYKFKKTEVDFEKLKEVLIQDGFLFP